MFNKIIIALLALSASFSLTAQAAPVPYMNIGTEAPVASFIASNTGNITAYFFGSSASYTSRIGMKVNGVSTGIYGLSNQSSSYGDSRVLGSVNAGDLLEFQLQVIDIGTEWSSNSVNNSDLLNHVYENEFGGDDSIPPGSYLGFEDLPYLGDADYNDHQFVIVNESQPTEIRATAVPEPENMLLLGLGLVILGVSRQHRKQ